MTLPQMTQWRPLLLVHLPHQKTPPRCCYSPPTSRVVQSSKVGETRDQIAHFKPYGATYLDDLLFSFGLHGSLLDLGVFLADLALRGGCLCFSHSICIYLREKRCSGLMFTVPTCRSQVGRPARLGLSLELRMPESVTGSADLKLNVHGFAEDTNTMFVSPMLWAPRSHTYVCITDSECLEHRKPVDLCFCTCVS